MKLFCLNTTTLKKQVYQLTEIGEKKQWPHLKSFQLLRGVAVSMNDLHLLDNSTFPRFPSTFEYGERKGELVGELVKRPNKRKLLSKKQTLEPHQSVPSPSKYSYEFVIVMKLRG